MVARRERQTDAWLAFRTAGCLAALRAVSWDSHWAERWGPMKATNLGFLKAATMDYQSARLMAGLLARRKAEHLVRKQVAPMGIQKVPLLGVMRAGRWVHWRAARRDAKQVGTSGCSKAAL